MTSQISKMSQVKDGFDPLGSTAPSGNHSTTLSTPTTTGPSKTNPPSNSSQNQTKKPPSKSSTSMYALFDIKKDKAPTQPTLLSDKLKERPAVQPRDKEFKTKFYKDDNYIRVNSNLFQSEKIISHEQAGFENDKLIRRGIFLVTNFRLIFTFERPNEAENKKYLGDYLRIPLFLIGKIEKHEDKQLIDRFMLDITLKNSLKLNFIIFNKENWRILAELENYSTPVDHSKYLDYSFEYLKYLWSKDNFVSGWEIYNDEEEYKRQGVCIDKTYKLKFTKVNNEFKLCDTYPELLVVPSDASDRLIKDAAKVRTYNRFPVLSYFYNKKKCKVGLWRSSQVSPGIKNIDKDKSYVELISNLNGNLVIVDAKESQIININMPKFGTNVENEEKYNKTEVKSCELGSIYDTRKALNSVYSFAFRDDIMEYGKSFAAIESSNWLEYIQRLLKVACAITQMLIDNTTVLVHCSEGWDRTPQLISLVELFLDPYYRTIKGFAVLVEKEWLSFGHPFGRRNGIFIKEKPIDEQKSPIFIQFLDCVHQLVYQFPNCFEFNNEFLLFLALNSMTNQYGTFLYNNDKQRDKLEGSLKTCSVWSEILINVEKYKNLFYEVDKETEILIPNYGFYNLIFWEDFFLKDSLNIERSYIYTDDTKKTKYDNTYDFYVWNKKEDEKKYKEVENDLVDLNFCVKDIMNTFKGTDIYNSFDDYTKNYMSFIERQEKLAKMANM